MYLVQQNVSLLTSHTFSTVLESLMQLLDKKMFISILCINFKRYQINIYITQPQASDNG